VLGRLDSNQLLLLCLHDMVTLREISFELLRRNKASILLAVEVHTVLGVELDILGGIVVQIHQLGLACHL